MARTKVDRRPLGDRVAAEAMKKTEAAVERIIPLLEHPTSATPIVVDVLADLVLATVKVTLKHVAPYREA